MNDLLPFAIPATFLVGYWAGSARSFAHLGYGGLRLIFSTMLPCYGLHWDTFYGERNPLNSLLVWLRIRKPSDIY